MKINIKRTFTILLLISALLMFSTKPVEASALRTACIALCVLAGLLCIDACTVLTGGFGLLLCLAGCGTVVEVCLDNCPPE
jgi:hypothetical protein